jgi:fructosamine-3-kinase
MADPDVRARLERAAGVEVRELRGIGGAHGAAHFRAVLADGHELFVKTASADSSEDGGALRAEATGLRWLGEAGVALVPEVFFISNEMLALPWLPEAGADRAAAERFGRDLALLHAAGADSFGAPWPGSPACRCRTTRQRRGLPGTRRTGCCRTAGSGATRARCSPPTRR